ncbi:MAG: hypothetical protein BZY88_05295 [SAR202 cluster bacterium Io17-Chloro-G9]|nr:MAG: hypothetical protein BZY88_05295 [SAR202 cluster bacterium Io17-Chloro-G9]
MKKRFAAVLMLGMVTALFLSLFSGVSAGGRVDQTVGNLASFGKPGTVIRECTIIGTPFVTPKGCEVVYTVSATDDTFTGTITLTSPFPFGDIFIEFAGRVKTLTEASGRWIGTGTDGQGAPIRLNGRFFTDGTLISVEMHLLGGFG